MIGTAETLSIATLLRVYRRRISLTWLLIFCETSLTILIPLFIGFAIDGLLSGNTSSLAQLAGIMFALTLLSVARRMYDTRVYGTIRVDFGKAQAARSPDLAVSALNARLGMGRELVDFLEDVLPQAMASILQFTISVIILYSFAPVLALSSMLAVIGMILIYALFHRTFYRWNGALNQQTERQVGILERRQSRLILQHLIRLRRFEVKLSDAEAALYGTIFVLLVGLLIFNLWFATVQLSVTPGTIFAIVSYTWEFAEAALALPITLQSWSRLSEITKRLNGSLQKSCSDLP